VKNIDLKSEHNTTCDAWIFSPEESFLRFPSFISLVTTYLRNEDCDFDFDFEGEGREMFIPIVGYIIFPQICDKIFGDAIAARPAGA
jgi:hypothetical protein